MLRRRRSRLRRRRRSVWWRLRHGSVLWWRGRDLRRRRRWRRMRSVLAWRRCRRRMRRWRRRTTPRERGSARRMDHRSHLGMHRANALGMHRALHLQRGQRLHRLRVPQVHDPRRRLRHRCLFCLGTSRLGRAEWSAKGVASLRSWLPKFLLRYGVCRLAGGRSRAHLARVAWRSNRLGITTNERLFLVVRWPRHLQLSRRNRCVGDRVRRIVELGRRGRKRRGLDVQRRVHGRARVGHAVRNDVLQLAHIEAELGRTKALTSRVCCLRRAAQPHERIRALTARPQGLGRGEPPDDVFVVLGTRLWERDLAHPIPASESSPC